MGDRIAIMNDGQLQQYDTPNAIYHAPANLFVATFIGSPTMNILEGDLIQGECQEFVADEFRYRWKAGRWPGEFAGNRVAFGIRATDVKVRHVGSQEADIRALVEFQEPLGSDLFLSLRVGKTLFVVRTDPDFEVRVGEEVDVSIPEARVHLFELGNGKRVPEPTSHETGI